MYTMRVLLRGCDPRPVHVRFMVDRVPLGQGFLRELRFSLGNVIPPMLSTRLHPHHESPTRCHIGKLCVHYKNYTLIWVLRNNTYCYFSTLGLQASPQ